MSTDLIERITTMLDWQQRTVEPNEGDFGIARMTQRSIDEDKRQIHFICSTGDIDRYGEIVEPEAYRSSIDAFMRNPIFAAGHVYIGQSGEPTVIGHWVKVWISERGLEGIAQFDDEDELAKRYWNLYRKGHLRAVSVGFIARRWDMRDMDIEKERQRVRVFTDVDLLEISAVAIPANENALVRSRSAQDQSDPIGDAVERKLKELFHAGPGGLMTTLAQDVAELVVASRGLGMDDPYGDIDDDPGLVPGDDPESEVDTHELNAALRDVLGR